MPTRRTAALLGAQPLRQSPRRAGGRHFTDPSQFTFHNYANRAGHSTITNSLLSTVAITVPATVLVVVIGSLAGYAFAWMDFPGRDWWFMVVVSLLVVPVQVALVPVARLSGRSGSSRRRSA